MVDEENTWLFWLRQVASLNQDGTVIRTGLCCVQKGWVARCPASLNTRPKFNPVGPLLGRLMARAGLR